MRHAVCASPVLSLLAACASDDPTSSSPPSSRVSSGDAINEEQDALSAARDSLGNADGTWNTDAVLRVFAARHGQLPGIERADEPTASILDDQALADVLSKQLEELVPEVPACIRSGEKSAAVAAGLSRSL